MSRGFRGACAAPGERHFDASKCAACKAQRGFRGACAAPGERHFDASKCASYNAMWQWQIEKNFLGAM